MTGQRLFYGKNDGARTFFDEKNDGAKAFFCEKNDGAGTFFGRKNDGAKTFFEAEEILLPSIRSNKFCLLPYYIIYHRYLQLIQFMHIVDLSCIMLISDIKGRHKKFSGNGTGIR